MREDDGFTKSSVSALAGQHHLLEQPHTHNCNPPLIELDAEVATLP